MSGGSWDYASDRINDIADRLAASKDPHRRALGKRASLFADAIHDIELVDSFDLGDGDEVSAIRTFLGKNADALVLAEVIADAKTIAATLAKLLAKAKGGKP